MYGSQARKAFESAKNNQKNIEDSFGYYYFLD